MNHLIIGLIVGFGLGWLCRAIYQWKLDSDRTQAQRALERQQKVVTPFSPPQSAALYKFPERKLRAVR
jgi:uncharacterized membrane protein YciS (DUF1049 family)